MIRTVITVAGPPGSGKSTAGRLVAEMLGLEYRSAGEVFRAQAREHGMSLEEFGQYAEAHPEVDRELDRAMQELARPGRLLDGRIQGPLCRKNGVPVHHIVVLAAEEVRVRRVAHRDSEAIETARALVRAREASERERYLRYYEIDLDQDVPDLRVDSTNQTPHEVAAAIVEFVRAREAATAR